MKLPKTHPSRYPGFVRRHSTPGLFSQPANEPPAGGAPAGGGAPGGTEPPKDDKGKDDDNKPTFTQADLNRIGKKEKEAGKRAAEEAFAKQLGVPLEEAQKIIADHKAAEDAKLSDADKAKQAAEADKAAAAANKNLTATEVRTARIERALGAEEFPKIGDDKATAKVVRMVEAELALDASTEDCREAVKELKKEFPQLFEKAKDDGKTPPGAKPPIPGSAPKGKPPAPAGDNESDYDRGVRRARERNQNKRGFNPLDPKPRQDA